MKIRPKKRPPYNICDVCGKRIIRKIISARFCKTCGAERRRQKTLDYLRKAYMEKKAVREAVQ